MFKNNPPLIKLLVSLLILIIVRVLRLEAVLIGENFIATAFFILLGLGLLFSAMDDKDREIQRLQAELKRKKN